MHEIWMQRGLHPGDNSQVQSLGIILSRHFDWSTRWIEPKDQLSPPWPDIVIGAGYRTVQQALKIKALSGYKAKVIRIGRPRANLSLFDLVLVTEQYGLPSRPNLVTLTVPLIRPETLSSKKEKTLAADFARFPRPWNLIVVGGPTNAIEFTQKDVEKFLKQSLRGAEYFGGSAFIIPSPRTPCKISENDYRTHLPVRLFSLDEGKDNPYLYLLSMCDRVYSSGDSASVAADALYRGKPLFLGQPTLKKKLLSFDRFWEGYFQRQSQAAPTALDHLIKIIFEQGWIRPRKRLDRFRQILIERKAAMPLESNQDSLPLKADLESEIEALIQRIIQLFPEQRT